MQAAYQADTSLGMGNYRIILAGPRRPFLYPTETKNERPWIWGNGPERLRGKQARNRLWRVWSDPWDHPIPPARTPVRVTTRRHKACTPACP